MTIMIENDTIKLELANLMRVRDYLYHIQNKATRRDKHEEENMGSVCANLQMCDAGGS